MTLEGYARPTKARALARFNPLGLMRAMGDEPWEGQAEIVESVWANRETYARTCHAIGKTFIEARVIAAWTLAWWPEVLTVVLTPTEDQLTGGVWRELNGIFERWVDVLPGTLGVKQWTSEGTGLLAIGRSPRPERPGSLQGLHSPNLLLVVDEAPEVDPRLWKAARSLLTGSNTRLLAAGNPTRTDGEFYRRSMDPKPGDNVIRIHAFQTPNLVGIDPESSDLHDELAARMTEETSHSGLIDARYVMSVLEDGVKAEWDSRVMANFPEATDDTLIPRAWVDRARTNELPSDHPLEAGMDVARFGDDRCVLFPLRGGVIFEPLVWRKTDLMASAGKVVDWCKGQRVRDIRVDSGGMGPGLIDRLIELGLPITEVIHSEAPNDKETFHDRRTEYWWAMRDVFEAGEIDLTHLSVETFNALAAELTSVRYTFTSAGKRRIEQKIDTKKRLGRSPDLADALVYANIPAMSFDAFVGSY